MKVKPAFYTVYGEFYLHRRERFTLPEMTALLGSLGFGEAAVRSALFRLLREGQLEGERQGGRRRYWLAADAREWLAAGVARVHAEDEPTWDGRWRILLYSVPEAERALRDRMRRELAWLGFGSLGQGAWISPLPLLPTMIRRLEQVGVGRTVAFEGEWRGPGSAQELVASAWDLEAVAARYRLFLRQDLAPAEVRGAAMPGAEAFRTWVSLVYEYRKFLHLDPGLPKELLPQDWPGGEVRRRLLALLRALEPVVEPFVEQVREAGVREAALTSGSGG